MREKGVDGEIAVVVVVVGRHDVNAQNQHAAVALLFMLLSLLLLLLLWELKLRPAHQDDDSVDAFPHSLYSRPVAPGQTWSCIKLQSLLGMVMADVERNIEVQASGATPGTRTCT